ncbi:MAG: M20/M25/M40 family metallo-hydrolase [Melioribacteraceae bacterium]|nr:M20/M25/M40 family metallo-hydrolase [Melioribacteraceae bacterium]
MLFKLKNSESRILLIILSVIFASSSIIYAQKYDYKHIADSVLNYSLSERAGYKWLRELCNIGPRLSGTDNYQKATDWAVQKFTEIGCDSVWLQTVKVPFWVRGEKESAEIVSPEKAAGRKLSIASLGGSIGTNGILKAKVIEVSNFDDVKNLSPSEAKGKILFFNEPFDQSEPTTFRSYGKAVRQRGNGAIEAAKLGGVAALVRSVTSKPDNVPHVGMMRYADSVMQVPAAAIGVEDADYLSSLLKSNPDVEVSIEMDCSPMGEADSYNIIAQVNGSEFPDEVIVVGGHFDSWDKGHGAHDDGAPCIQTMEVLHQIKVLNLKPKRTIRCVLFANEESGLRGAVEYGKYAETAKEKHYAAIESDRGVFTPRGFNIDADSMVIAEMQAWLPYLNKLKIDWIRKGSSGADISRIKNTKALIGYVPDDQRYFDFHHSANDVYQSVNAREMQYGTAAITLLAYLISQEGLK